MKFQIGDRVWFTEQLGDMPHDEGIVVKVYGIHSCDVYFDSIRSAVRCLTEELEEVGHR